MTAPLRMSATAASALSYSFEAPRELTGAALEGTDRRAGHVVKCRLLQRAGAATGSSTLVVNGAMGPTPDSPTTQAADSRSGDTSAISTGSSRHVQSRQRHESRPR